LSQIETPQMRLLHVMFFFLLLFPVMQSFAQDPIIRTDSIPASGPVTINDIRISGNKRTKSFIVLREVPFRKGDQLAEDDLNKQLILTRQQLMNTTLFVDVNVYVALRKAGELVINIDLKERWYFFPLPYFRLIDRNFNQWWVEQKEALTG
jgi:hypothetical protein